MCFYFKQSKDALSIENRFDAKIENPQTFITNNQFNGFSFPETPVILNSEPKLIKNIKWGLIPQWAKDSDFAKYTLNAKIETLTEKPSFKNYVQNRCLIIADGFYEWQWLDSKGKSKQKYLITLENEEIFTFAGIWSVWKNPQDNQSITTYSLLTTEADEFMSKIHNSKKRMPIVLNKETEQMWLNNVDLKSFQKPVNNFIASKIS